MNQLFVVDRGGSFALRDMDGWSTVFEVDTKEELDLKMAAMGLEVDLKMAAMGLEVDWASKSDTYQIWPVRRIP